MTKVIELKDKIFKFCSAYEIYLVPAGKFILALTLFCFINGSIGFMAKISTLPVALLLALVCCLFPLGMTMMVAGGLVLANLYVLSLEVALMALLIFMVIYFLYFRFTPKDGVFTLLTPILFKLNIPYILPVSTGLFRNAYSVISVICGTVAFYFIDGIYQNVSTLVAEGTQSEKMTVTATQLLSNKEMYLTIGVFVITSAVVYIIRRLSIDHAWKIAVISGILIQISGLLAGYMVFSISGRTAVMIVGNIVSLLIGFVLEFIFLGLDYERTERVQFEDDEYYYFVKAVPKKMISSADKQVKQFSFERKKQELKEDSRRKIAEELEIDEELLR
uniref:hypothetical protein n=1 Tax=Agathobacter sp. TaxID=2021311 RepID=UPI004057040D